MKVTKIETSLRRRFPLIDAGQGFYEIRNGANGKLLFGIHCIDPTDPVAEGLAGTYIREEVGAAESLLPDGFTAQVFEHPEAAYVYCMAALTQISASINLAA